MLSVKTRIGQYRTAYAGEISKSDDKLLLVLQQNESMPAAWISVERRIRSSSDYPSLFYVIINAKAAADRAEKFDEEKRRIVRYMEQRASAAKLMKEYFDEEYVVDCDDMRASESARSDKTNVLKCREAFSWAFDRLSQSLEFAQSGLDAEKFFSSQKTNASTIFGIMICDHLQKAFGSPLYNFVASLTAASYQLDRVVEPSAVARAWKRHLERREASAIQVNGFHSQAGGNRLANDLG